ncbi:hypothetical protein [Aeromonas dhakensis]|uniref:hypothetical protein n=1 Tax=Aeromonas dhakensis TaxID=196024 RepID=UPI001BCEF4F6|nr:hypothetical protein [Aeromonas dhakensis]MBS4714913.1 hypothetical protein [Aeromonas dhakensis]
MSRQRKNQWCRLIKELIVRSKNAIFSVKFILFFVGGLILLGGIGVWLPAISDEKTKLFESQNVFTYTVAIIGTLFIESIFQEHKDNDLTSLGILSGIIAFVLCFIGFTLQKSGVSTLVNIGLILTLCVYFFSYANDPRFDGNDDSPADPLGYKEPNVKSITNA